jgi:hypothetical protein
MNVRECKIELSSNRSNEPNATGVFYHQNRIFREKNRLPILYLNA